MPEDPDDGGSDADSLTSRLRLARELLDEERGDDAKAAYFQILEEDAFNEEARTGMREALALGSALDKLPREGSAVELAPPGREGEDEAHEAVLSALGSALPSCPGARAVRYRLKRDPDAGDALRGEIAVEVVDVRGLSLGHEEATFFARQHTEKGASGIEVKVEREASSAVTTPLRRQALAAIASKGRTLAEPIQVLWAPDPNAPFGFILAIRTGTEIEVVMPFGGR